MDRAIAARVRRAADAAPRAGADPRDRHQRDRAHWRRSPARRRSASARATCRSTCTTPPTSRSRRDRSSSRRPSTTARSAGASRPSSSSPTWTACSVRCSSSAGAVFCTPRADARARRRVRRHRAPAHARRHRRPVRAAHRRAGRVLRAARDAILVGEPEGVGPDHPLSYEILAPGPRVLPRRPTTSRRSTPARRSTAGAASATPSASTPTTSGWSRTSRDERGADPGEHAVDPGGDRRHLQHAQAVAHAGLRHRRRQPHHRQHLDRPPAEHPPRGAAPPERPVARHGARPQRRRRISADEIREIYGGTGRGQVSVAQTRTCLNLQASCDRVEELLAADDLPGGRRGEPREVAGHHAVGDRLERRLLQPVGERAPGRAGRPARRAS